MADDMSDAERRSLVEWAANDGAKETAADDATAEAARVAEAAKAAEIFAAGRKDDEPPVDASDPATASASAAPAAEAVEATVEPQPAETPPPKPKKAVQPLPPWMRDRLAEQAGKQRDAEQKAAESKARADVAEAELAELRKRGASGEAPAPTRDAPGADFVPRTQVEARAAEIARMDAFNASADQAYFAGKAAYKEDFDTALQPLQAMGAMQRMDFQEAALATGAAHDVLFELGSDPDKASEILSFLKRGNTAKATAEMTRIADGVAARKAAEEAAAKAAKGKKTPVSAVPAPIRPVGGSALPVIDLEKADDETFDRELSGMMKRMGWT